MLSGVDTSKAKGAEHSEGICREAIVEEKTIKPDSEQALPVSFHPRNWAAAGFKDTELGV